MTVRPLFGHDGNVKCTRFRSGWHFDRHDAVEHLDPALDLRGFGRLVAKPIDERLHPRDFFVLFLLRLPEPFEPRVALDEVLRIRCPCSP